MFSRKAMVQRLLVLVCLAGMGGAWAQSPPPSDPPAQASQQARGQRGNLPESVRRVERQTGGEVLRAEPMQRDGREVYRLKVLTADGRVRVVQDDPNSGQGNERPARAKNKEKQSSETGGSPPQY